jgi:hypothetical protein
MVKPKTKEAKETGGKKRNIGGQKGHKKHVTVHGDSARFM